MIYLRILHYGWGHLVSWKSKTTKNVIARSSEEAEYHAIKWLHVNSLSRVTAKIIKIWRDCPNFTCV